MWENSEQKIYFNTYGGKFTREVPEGTEAAETRFAEKTNRKINYLAYGRLTGHLTSVNYNKREHDGRVYRTLNIEMESTAGAFALQLNVFSNAARCFFMVMENIDPSLEIRLSIHRNGEMDTLFVSQPGHGGKWQALKWAYTRDNPNGKPEWEKKTVQGEERWDNSKEIEWLINKLPDINAMLSLQPIEHGPPDHDGIIEAPSNVNHADDLPF